VKAKAEEYGVSSRVMLAVVECESKFVPDIQSRHRYTPKNVPKGYAVGDREQSYGLVQIHLPAHPTITKEQATDPKFAVEFLAKNLKQGRGGMWTCYKDLAMR
jgi:hypothetical protein